MPKYIGYATVRMYRSFEFEADDDDLAYDHFDMLIDHKGIRILDEWQESGPDDVFIDMIDEV